MFYIKDKLRQMKYQKYLPSTQKNSDIYIVEFPKSGITWLSALIANINLIESGSNQTATYFNIQQLIPDIHMNNNILEKPMWDVPSCRFIKSHSEFCPYYNHVIYLVRNPVSVMNSYFHYTIMLNIFRGSFRTFLLDERFGLHKWKRHISSWLLRGDSSQRIHMIRYEDLKSNPIETLKNLYKNLGLNVDRNVLDKAIILSNFETMKKNEDFYKKFNPNTDLVFVREGRSKIIIEESLEKYILAETREIREKLGY